MSYSHKHIGDQCFKCNLGQFRYLHFIRIEESGFCTGYMGCPDDEHLHMSCGTCGYSVWEKTAEQRQMEHDKLKGNS